MTPEPDYDAQDSYIGGFRPVGAQPPEYHGRATDEEIAAQAKVVNHSLAMIGVLIGLVVGLTIFLIWMLIP